MTDISQLTGGPAHAGRQQVLRARVTRAPASETDALRAVAINYTDVYDYEVPAGNWTPRGTALPVVGAECVLIIDDDGDTWVPTWEGATAFPPPPDVNPPRVTSLPGSPIDGQECYYVADAANGVLWHLRYNAGSASGYKWEVVGGRPLWSEVPTVGNETTASTSYTDLATAGPSIALPLAGDYDIETTCLTNSNSAGQGTYMSYAIGATAAADVDANADYHATTADGHVQTRRRRKTNLSAVTLTAKYKVTGGTGTWYGLGTAGGGRSMSAMPVRVA